MPTKNFACLVLAILVIIVAAAQLQAIPTDALKVPLQTVKKEVWSYMFAVKAAAVVVGAAFALIKQSLAPFGIGAGIFGGIQFFDTVLGDGSAALIS